jgi:cytoplasmic iron level regulating protein YaaA (DUF328/UPF0246 family)
MLILLSPAKTLDLSPPPKGLPVTRPTFKRDIAMLMRRCKTLDVAELRKLMKLSEPLAELNHERFQAMSPRFTLGNSKPALLTFQGDVYRKLDAASLSRTDLLWAQDHLRILSGLYGLLRPLDLMQPYRLEMGTRLDTERGGNLYAFWGGRLADALNAEHKKKPVAAVLNLASNEYAKAVPEERLAMPMITADFQEWRDGKLKTISFSAKKARGLMARFVVEKKIDKPAGLKRFKAAGYSYQPELSTDRRLLFARQKPAA